MTTESELQTARETNARLNRRLQELESVIAKGRFYQEGFRRGYKVGEEDARAMFERDLGQYKKSTRAELRKLRELLENRNDSL